MESVFRNLGIQWAVLRNLHRNAEAVRRVLEEERKERRALETRLAAQEGDPCWRLLGRPLRNLMERLRRKPSSGGNNSPGDPAGPEAAADSTRHDALAKQGMRFTRHYTGAAVCAPARCVLLTGKHLGHAEIRNNGDSGNGRRFPGQRLIQAFKNDRTPNPKSPLPLYDK